MPARPPELFGVNISEIARSCRVSLKTATRWKNGTTCPPKTALMVLRRDLGIFSPEWAGWTVDGPEIVSPENWRVRRDDALAVPLLEAHIAALRAQVSDLKAARDEIEEQPEPGELPAISA